MTPCYHCLPTRNILPLSCHSPTTVLPLSYHEHVISTSTATPTPSTTAVSPSCQISIFTNSELPTCHRRDTILPLTAFVIGHSHHFDTHTSIILTCHGTCHGTKSQLPPTSYVSLSVKSCFNLFAVVVVVIIVITIAVISVVEDAQVHSGPEQPIIAM